jgi:hypothetical protein
MFLMDPSDPMSEIDMQRYMKWVDAGTSSPVMQDLKELIDSPLKIGYGAEYEWEVYTGCDVGPCRKLVVGVSDFAELTLADNYGNPMLATPPAFLEARGTQGTVHELSVWRRANAFVLRTDGTMYASYANTPYGTGTSQNYPPPGYDGWVNIPPGRWYEESPDGAESVVSEVPRSEFVWHEIWEVFKRAGGLPYESAHAIANGIAGRTGTWNVPGYLTIYAPAFMPRR